MWRKCLSSSRIWSKVVRCKGGKLSVDIFLLFIYFLLLTAVVRYGRSACVGEEGWWTLDREGGE